MKTLLLISLLLVAGLPRLALAQAPDPTFLSSQGTYTPGSVFALGPQQADGKRLVSGNFTRVNGAYNNTELLRLDATGAVDAAFAQNVGNAGGVRRMKALPTGQYLLCGQGSTVLAGGISRSELLRLNADGTADATFNAGTGPAVAGGSASGGRGYAVQPDGKILVVGYFDSFNGVAANGVVRLNANGSVDTGFAVGTGVGCSASNFIYAQSVAVQADGKILVGGNFTSFNGVPTYGLIRLTATGSVDASFTSGLLIGTQADGIVLQPNGQILVCGNITTSNRASGVVRLNTNGTLDTSFYPATNSFSYGGYADNPLVLQPDGKVLLAGYFIAGNSYHVARFNTDGTLDTSFTLNPGPNTYVSAFGLQADGTLLVGGSFFTFNGTEQPLGRLTSTGALDPTFAPKLQKGGFITTMVRQPDGQYVLGGDITEYNGLAVHRFLRVSATGVPDAAFSAATGVLAGVVKSLAVQADGKILAGTEAGLLRFNTTGAPDASFTPFLRAPTTAVAVQPDGRILMGGAFSGTSNGVDYNGVARLLATGAFDPSFARQAPAAIGRFTSTDALLLQPDGRVVVAGLATPAGGSSTARVVRYESTGALDATFASTTTFASGTGATSSFYRPSALALQPDGNLLVGGTFDQVNGTTQHGVARLLASGALDATFTATATLSGTVMALALQPNGRVLLGGNFVTPRPGGNFYYLARVLANGTPDPSFGDTANPQGGYVNSLVVEPTGGIVLVGAFYSLGNEPHFQVGRITAPNVLAVATPAVAAAHFSAWPVPAHTQLHVAPDLGARPQALELLDALGRPVRQQTLAPGLPEVTVDVAGLAPGLYLLRVQYATGTATHPVAVE